MRTSTLAGLALFVATSALAAGTRPSAAAFSRSRWIAERAASARFDGGALPATQAGFEGLLGEAAPARPAPPLPPGPPNVRVSQDILAADGNADQPEPETEAEPSFALHPANERIQLAGYQENRFADGGARALTAARSQDGGRTWSEQLVPALTQASGGPWERASDPWVAYGPDGTAYYASIAFFESDPRNAVLVSVSADGGQSWDPPATVHAVANGDFDDKEAVVVDGAADSPYRGRVYVGWDTVTNGNRQILRVAHSDDGVNFSPARDVYATGANIGCLPLVGPRGVAYLVWVSYGLSRGAILVARSTDGGETWSAPATVATERSRGVRGLRTGDGLPAAAIDPHTGKLYVVWTDDRFTPGTDQVLLASSGDGGATWSAPRRVSDGPDDAPAFTPAVAVTGQGQVGVAYSSLRNDPSRRFLVDQYLTVTNRRGVFQKARRMSTKSFDVRYAAVADGYFLGDYQGLAAGKTALKPLWIATSEPSLLNPQLNQPDAVTLAAGRR